MKRPSGEDLLATMRQRTLEGIEAHNQEHVERVIKQMKEAADRGIYFVVVALSPTARAGFAIKYFQDRGLSCELANNNFDCRWIKIMWK